MIDPRFHRVELELARLKEEVAAGRMTADALEQALDRLTFEANGRFWALGANSGKWYASDGDTWAEAQPPRIAEPPLRASAPPRETVPPPVPPPVQPPPPSAHQPQSATASAKSLRPHQWILGCGIGCLAPLLFVGGLAQIAWARSEYESTQLGTLAVCIGVFVASICAVALLRRIPFLVFLGAAILWTLLGFLMQTTGFAYEYFGWFISIAWISGAAAVVGVLLGLIVRKLVAPRSAV